MDKEVKMTIYILCILIAVLIGALAVGSEIGRKQHSGFCPKCGRWYDNQYNYCQDDGEELLKPSNP